MRKYCFELLFIISLILSSIALFNWVVDPYGIWEHSGFPRLNAEKPQEPTHRMLKKRIKINDQTPIGVILGTSRANHLSEKHPALFNGSYNWSMPASPIEATKKLFFYAQSKGRLKQAIIGLDFFAFNVYLPTPPGLDDASPIPLNGYGFLLNSSIIVDSFQTAKHNWRRAIPMHEHGDNKKQFVSVKPSLDLINKTEQEGCSKGNNPTRLRFQNTERYFANHIYFPPPRFAYELIDQRIGQSSLAHYRAMLTAAYKQNNLDIRLYISPSHSRLWMLINELGLWPRWEEWKRELVRINEEEAHRFGKEPFPLWDFSGFNSITTEDVPNSCAETKMQWYFESSHFSSETGALILDQILDFHDLSRIVPADFGVLLSSSNIDANLNALREARLHYQETHQDDLREIVEIVHQRSKLITRQHHLANN